ncbi:Zinc finger, RING/FYVE/PHD-type [Artemisia annua]|uniref:RING-type E3 ubiquitin transferase n=1 Tax=Artemisia annua TaxID=35608 RepID=A0A2U1MH24_ARTAN|nr:Zinc finger, RING/FYVE/PHD-type [Artemisia annua]
MTRILGETRQENGKWVQLPAPSEITVSPALLWVIVSIAAIFFISGVFHVLFRFFKRSETYQYPSSSYSNRPQSLGRQLQQLFRLQDSGLDQSFIDSLPVFDYKNITGIKDPFDCAVCLCEFSPHDKLRLIPICSHAFHIQCIDTWLLSNSTCPLCRANLSLGLNTEGPLCNLNGPRENLMNVSTNSIERVFSVRLGKFKSFNGGERSNCGEISRCNLDARRCFSMGSFRYVLNDVDLQVAFFNAEENAGCGRTKDVMNGGQIKYDSFSVSKVWLWSKKGKFSGSSLENVVAGAGVSSSQNTI